MARTSTSQKPNSKAPRPKIMPKPLLSLFRNLSFEASMTKIDPNAGGANSITTGRAKEARSNIVIIKGALADKNYGELFLL